MGRFKIYQDHHADATLVSNLFIDKYMKDANDAQLKIYLYLLRAMNTGMPTSISDIADKFNHTEKDVLRALKYWEKCRLLLLEYDEAKSLSGVRLLEISENTGRENIPLAPVVPLPSKTYEQAAITPVSEKQKSDFSKPAYSLDQLKEFKNNEETAQILFVAEQYIGRPLSPSELRTIFFFADKLRFSEDLIDYLLQYCVDKGKKDFRYIEKVALSWAEEGITTPKQAAKFARKYDKSVYDIMKALGKSGAPTKAEADYAVKWIKEYGFTQDIIAEACTRTVMATDSHRFEYADRILSSWYKNQVHHKADIRALDEAHAQARNAKSASAPPAAKAFNQFPQRSYDFDALEQELLRN